MPMGLCPECLLKAGFPSGTEPAASGFVPPTVEEIARLFPQLEILGFLGKGGMGAVYKARQPILDRFIALKILPPTMANDPGFVERFNREARALARLNHPNIVTVYDFGQTGGMPYLMMELVDGINLREMEQAGRLTPEQALAIVPQICEALQFAHNEGIVHRDIKPENLLLDKKGRLKITDFGIAKIIGLPADKMSLTGVRDVMGTPHYMAPEQIEKPQTVDHRADIYSLGVVFYEMLTGELPMGKFQPPSRKVIIDARLDEVVLRTLEKEPERRYQQASEVKTRVENISATPPPPVTLPASSSIPEPPRSDKMILPAFLLALCFGVFGAHRFYVGKIRTGLLQLGLLLAWIPLIVAIVFAGDRGEPALGLILGFVVVGCGIWATVDWILILCKAFTDGQGRRLTSWVGTDAGSPAQAPILPQAPIDRGALRTDVGGIVKAPAVGLIVVGALKVLSAIKSVVFFSLPGFGIVHSVFSALGMPERFFIGNALMFSMATVPLIIFGGTQMLQLRSFAWAMTGAILAIVSGGLLGIPVGIWALVVLLREDVRAHFNQTPRTPVAPGPQSVFAEKWPLMVAALAVVIFLIVAAVVAVFLAVHSARAEGSPPSMPVVLAATNVADQSIDVGASADFSTSRSVSPVGRLTMKVDRGDVRLTGSDGEKFSIKIVREVSRASDAEAAQVLMEEHLTIAQHGDEIVISAAEPASLRADLHSLWRAITRPDLDAHYEITVPKKYNTHIETQGGDVTVEGISTNVFAKTMGGKLDLNDVGGPVVGNTMGGDIDSSGCKGSFRAHTMGGSIDIREFSGADVEASTAGGSVSASFAAPPRLDCDLHTMGGDVTLKMPRNSAVSVDASTVGGSVTTDFSVLSEGKSKESSLRGTINGGGPTLRLKTMGGSIEVLAR